MESGEEFDDMRIISKGDSGQDIFLLGEAGDNPRMRINANTLIDTGTNATDTPGEWQLFTFTYGNGMKIYIDGVETAQNDISGNINTDPTINVHLGMRSDNSNHYDGMLDEVIVTNTTFTPSDVWNLFHSNLSRFEPTGTFDIWNQSAFELNISTGNNRVNVTTTIQILNGSSVNLSIGYHDGSWTFTDPQLVVNNTNMTFTISDTATNISLNYTLIPGGNDDSNFYSPAIYDDIVYEVFNVGVAGNISFTWTFVNGSVVGSTSAGNKGLDSNVNSTGANDKLVDACINGTGFCQTVSLGYINFTNIGDVTIQFNISLNQTEPPGVDIFGSLIGCNSATFDINTTPFIVNSSVGIGLSEICWICGNFTNASISKTQGMVRLIVNSSQ